MGSFDFAGTDAKSAADNVSAITAEQRANLAFNALNKQFGPAIANDPTKAFNAAKADVATQTIPTDVAQAGEDLKTKQLSNANTQNEAQRMAAYRATQLLKSQAQPDGSIPSDAYDKIVRPNAGLLGIDPGHIDALGQVLSQPGGSQHLDTIAQALVGPTKITGATGYGVGPDGNSVAITRDQYGNIHQQSLGGTTPVQQQRADTANDALDERKKQDAYLQAHGWTTAKIAEYRAATTANNSNFGSGGVALPGNGGPAAAPASAGSNTLPAPTTDLIGAGNPPGSNTAAPASQVSPTFDRLAPVGSKMRANAISQASSIANQDTTLQNTNKIITQTAQQIPSGAGAGVLLKDLPASTQANLAANLATIKSNEQMAWIASMKNSSGQTGIGRVLQSEAKNAEALFGNMGQEQSVGQLQYHLQLAGQALNQLHATAQRAFKAQWGQDPYALVGATQGQTTGGGAAAAAPASGWSNFRVKQ